jgi:hypothetical protein
MFIELRPIGNDRGWRLVGDVVACPVCERRAVYNRGEDRFFHLDGSTNAECWCYISRGGLVPRPILDPGDDEHQAPAEAGTGELGRRVA